MKQSDGLQSLLSSFHNVLHQNGSGNSADTAGNGGVSSGLSLSSSLVHVADDLAFSGDIDALCVWTSGLSSWVPVVPV